MFFSRRIKYRARYAGFTLIELLAVIAIISILAVLLLPMTRNMFAKAEQTQSMNNMRQIGIAFRLYTADNDNKLPGRPDDGKDRWPKDLAQYIAPNLDVANVQGSDLIKLKVYTDPSDPQNFIKVNDNRGPGLPSVNPLSNARNETSFIMNGYNDLDSYKDPSVEIRPNAIARQSETILLGTPKWDSNSTNHFFMDFDEGNNNDVLNLKAHGDGSAYVFMDGSVRFIKESDYLKPTEIPNVCYGDRLWLVNKDRTDVIKPKPEEPNS